jgi:glucose-6-phosphate 1-dehydrogenase
MSNSHSDALVFFGATGDLAYKKIFPSLHAMVRRGHLSVPVIGVAGRNWSLDQLKARARDSIEKHGGLDPAAFDKLSSLLRYVSGDYKDPATYHAIRKGLGSALRPAFYLAIPPALFEVVVEELARPGCPEGGKIRGSGGPHHRYEDFRGLGSAQRAPEKVRILSGRGGGGRKGAAG